MPASKKEGGNLNQGWCDVQFDSAEDAHEARDNMHRNKIFGRIIQVKKAVKQADQTLDETKPVWDQVRPE
ncbi:hypothetical protein TRVA0_006S04060 [Trichomonascus vanleenenianus]|uniref:uncharacterized protein n=1 Tax=Trichomonascus vanleenenianus TaxID=2268995 RepID=UPI003ECAD835